jgi:hypothetical protein
MAQKLKTAFKTGLFRESKSGTIAHKNKKTITADTHWDGFKSFLDPPALRWCWQEWSSGLCCFLLILI